MVPSIHSNLSESNSNIENLNAMLFLMSCAIAYCEKNDWSFGLIQRLKESLWLLHRLSHSKQAQFQENIRGWYHFVSSKRVYCNLCQILSLWLGNSCYLCSIYYRGCHQRSCEHWFPFQSHSHTRRPLPEYSLKECQVFHQGRILWPLRLPSGRKSGQNSHLGQEGWPDFFFYNYTDIQFLSRSFRWWIS